MSRITQQRSRRGLKGDMNIVHVVRFELTWFVNTLLHHLGVVVRPPDSDGHLSYVTLVVMMERGLFVASGGD